MKVLLLNFTYEPINFIPINRAIKLYFKNKVDIIADWDKEISWAAGKMKIPAILRLKYYIRWIPKKVRFNRQGIFRRDKFTCLYCGSKKGPLTIDHIIPRSQGGKSNYFNCATACYSCNNIKGDRTPEQAGMILAHKAHIPKHNLLNESLIMKETHPDWKIYLV